MNERHCGWKRMESALMRGRAILFRNKVAARLSHLLMLTSTAVLPAA